MDSRCLIIRLVFHALCVLANSVSLNPLASIEVVCFSVSIGVCADSLSESGGRAACSTAVT